MTIEHNDLIIKLEDNVRKLISRQNDLLQENNRLKEELEKSKQDLKFAHKENLELKSQYDNLRMARAIAKSEDDTIYTQQRLSKLVREINKCIALLNQQ